MSNANLLTILHLSDFHFSKRKQREQGIVVDALINDLKSLCVGHRKPDLILFTGDLVNAAGLDGHDDAYDFLIDRVSKATGCSDERIFLAAGNHDVAWNGLDAFAKEHNDWRAIIGSDNEMDQFNEIYAAGAFDAAVQKKFHNYIELERYIRGDEKKGGRRLKNAFVVVDHIEALNLDLVTFNTAVLSTGGHKSFDRDEGNLIVPEYAVMEAVKALTPGSLRVCVTHHPYAMMSQQSAKYLENEITKFADIHLFGHMHDPQPKKIVGAKGEVLSDQAGAVFTARKTYYIGYSLITYEREHKHSETLLRSYFKERSEFDDAVDVIEKGRWYPSQPARQYFRKLASPVDAEKFRLHLSTSALKPFLEREGGNGGDGDLHHKFVPPPLFRTFIQEAVGHEGKAEIEAPVAFSEISNGDSNLILYGRAEYGRTTLLKVLRYRCLADAHTAKFPRLPVMLDFSDISANVDNMLRKVRGSAELLPEGNDIDSLLELGYACVLVDDVHFSDTTRMRILRGFVDRFPKAQYIFSSPHSSATKLGAHVDPEMAARFEFVEIRELRRNDMRLLLAKDDRCDDVEAWLDRLQNDFKEINLPFTAANGTILIEILSEKYNFRPVNRAVLMEQFVDSTLSKAAVEQSRRETFDYTNKTDLLSHIAAWMAKSDEYILPKEAIRSEMKSYIDSRGLNPPIDDLLNEFLNARILISRQDGRISFRYRGVLEYFIALRMIADVKFKAWVMEKDRYLSFTNEIHYYAGKLRNDSELVELVAQRHEEIMKSLVVDDAEIDLHQFDTIHLPVEGRDDDLLSLGQGVASPPLSQEEKDAELETDIPTDAEDRQEVFRPKVADLKDQILLSLFLYSGMIKNMELIDDIDKRRHIDVLWRGWSVMLIAALRLAPRLAKERRIRINGALYEVQAPQGMSDTTLLRQMMIYLPHVHVRMISSTLGTEKLEKQLTEPMLREEPEPKIFEFFRTGLIADLRLDATPGAIAALAEKYRDNHYLLWALVMHVRELRRLDRVKESHFRAIESPLAGAIANLRGGSHKARQSEKRKQIAQLKQDRLLLTIKRNKER
ncbi:metallophosphoesterase family protein [Agrobacterium tumefaciens]|uniref:metallophosphoesterase family protein n=1 Tax=Agrobacterium tumefaciens TaxID=358 RepID=UPI0009784AEE|nr:hypothetical protein BV900_10940 [Agrobacterium tumefaciens]